MASFTGLGLMSGTSLDGLDVCCAEFTGDINCDIWAYRVLAAKTIPYEDEWRERLRNAINLTGLELIRLHYDYAHYMGKAIQKFMEENLVDTRIHFVSTHGHTVFHQPEERITFQLGDGETLASYLKCPLVTNFRVKDVALGGQGAPLVPSGERFLYNNVALCLNLGGIANVGVRDGSAYDICPCNTILNTLAQLNDPNARCDEDGELAKSGKIQQGLLERLNNAQFYTIPPPRSLGIERIQGEFMPMLNVKEFSVPDIARTFVEHIAIQITAACSNAVQDHKDREIGGSNMSPDGIRTRASSASAIKKHGENLVMITGGEYTPSHIGGAHNKFLMKVLERKLIAEGIAVDVTDEETVDFKEALVFAYLGLRCLLGKENVFASTTGARENCIAGSIHQPALLDPVATSMYSHFRFLLQRSSSIS